MRMEAPLIERKTMVGKTVEHHEYALRPVSRSLIVRFPFGGLVWNRPIAVDVREKDEWRRIPIADVTLILQLTLLTAGFLSAGLLFLLNRPNR